MPVIGQCSRPGFRGVRAHRSPQRRHNRRRGFLCCGRDEDGAVRGAAGWMAPVPAMLSVTSLSPNPAGAAPGIEARRQGVKGDTGIWLPAATLGSVMGGDGGEQR